MSHLDLKPGEGYPPHRDLYDVIILVFEGVVETLGQVVETNGLIFYRAGEPHGMFNSGTIKAKYIVFELLGRPNHVLDELFMVSIGMLAYYVKWHMLEAWRPLLFADEDLAAKKERNPVRANQRSQATLKKIRSKRLPDGSSAESFQSLLKNLATIVRNTCRRKDAPAECGTFTIDTQPSEQQKKALQLVKTIIM